ncbi:MAG: Non-specific serine/threonine protein kinase [Nocardia sp.]|uniref:serine/threonine-protein kinase n=1 Tax=Nocardia sp. TaxID=1821 RepID=UPI0026034938|nr:serine/threonine-protein kinase [Nocardia sp.]MCU1648615.1 Non-specific serine/threonine protein kinase [Nocardia sp.]
MAAENRAGSRFGQYELRRLLGVGGMGEVYEAHDTVRDRVVALKLLDVDLAKSATYVERFRRESRTAARLQEPHVIPVHDWGEVDGVLFIDMRLVRGRDLSAHLAMDGPLTPEQAVEVVEQIAAALDAAHESGLVHRDVKPANILLTGELFAYLVDFGIAHAESDMQLTTAGSAIGSFAYMAPERFEHSTGASISADIYALACVLYESLIGETPFRTDGHLATIHAHMMTQPPRASIRPGVPTGFDQVIATGMAKDPARRYTSASQLARAARAALSPVATTAQPLVTASPAAPTLSQPIPLVYPPPEATEPPVASNGHPATAPLAPPPKRILRPILAVGGVVVTMVLLGGVVGWQLLFGNDDGGPTAIGATTTIATTTVVTTTLAPYVGTVSGTDTGGFVGGLRCNADDPALAVGRTSASRLVVCRTGTGRYYYRGSRISDGATQEIDDPVPVGIGGFTATNPNDGTKYLITTHALTIMKAGQVLAAEPMLEYAHR